MNERHKIDCAKEEDRKVLVAILAQNGYTVRWGRGLEQKAAAAAAAPTKTEDAIRHFVDSLAVRTDSGNRISDATIRKIRQMAYETGFLTVEDGG